MKISVIIRSRNDENIIRQTLAALCSQDIGAELEFLSFDDGSADATPSIIREFPQVRMIPYDGRPYNPANTLNRAVAEASGEWIVFNNSDAVPLSRDCLEKLTAPLADPAVGAVYGNQLPRPDAFVLVRKDHRRAFGDGSVAASWNHMFSMVLSACRRETALRFPFDPAFQYSEDIDWSLRLKGAGLKIVYAPDARVEHSHNYTGAQLKKRFYNEGRANGMLYRRRPSWLRLLAATGLEILRDAWFILRAGEPGALLKGLRYRYLQRMSAYRGERDYCRENGIA
jgi:rhamnosyltransferase